MSIVHLSTSGPFSVSSAQIPIIEETRNCRYIGTSSIPIDKEGTNTKGWSYNPLDIFYDGVPHSVSGEQLFGLFRKEGKIQIRGCNNFDGKVKGIYIPSKSEIIFSTHVHDYFCSENTPRICVDGGRDYLKYTYVTDEDKEKFKIVDIDLINRTFSYIENDQRRHINYVIEFSSAQ